MEKTKKTSGMSLHKYHTIIDIYEINMIYVLAPEK